MSGPPPDPSTLEDDALVGRTIAGKFKIERRLGAGAMGAVYRAEQTALERPVAIKVMHGKFAVDATYAARFQREAKAASRLDHPNVIRVHDFGQEPDGLLYIAMELLECKDLFAILVEEWPLPRGRIVDLLAQVLSALAEAHDAGVMHRDLKPENIMVLRKKSEDGDLIDVVKVCDFGIAKLADPVAEAKETNQANETGGREAASAAKKRPLTTAGIVLGTPEYMSPEQARGDGYDARSDLYAVGVILYQLLTRRLPFEGKSAIEVVFKAMNHDPMPLDAHGPTAAPELDPICLKALSRAPAERYQSARAMRAPVLGTASPPAASERRRDSLPRPSPLAAAVIVPLLSPSAPRLEPETTVVKKPARARARARLGAAAAAALLAFAGVGAAVLHSRPAPSEAGSKAAPLSLPVAAEAPPSTAPAQVPLALAPAPRPSSGLPEPPPSGAASETVSPSRHPSRESHLPAVPHDPPPPLAAPHVDPPAAPALAPSASAPPPPLPVPAISAPPSASSSPAAAPLPSAPPAAPAAPTFDLGTARVEIGRVKSNNAVVSSSNVSRAFVPLAPKLTACYRSALAEAGDGASGGVATLHLESDDEGYVVVAHVIGSPSGRAARCIEGLSHQAHLDVDTGTANVDMTLTFRPF